MKKNVTLTLDDSLIRKLRHLAVESDLSLSAWIASRLEAFAHEEERVSESRRRALTRLKQGFNLGGSPLRRDEIYDR